ncbi:MAG: PfkB family carbohydrate kinase [Microbacteriaceae bacterium]|nr:PfkB family carbohydrate kinase [Microbacteriaceae bacterium]
MTVLGTIVVVGDVIDDIIVRPRRAIRQNTDTPALIERHPGGSSANTAAWLGHIGADVHFFGQVGAADNDRHTCELERFGVKAHLVSDTERPTGTIVIIVEGEDRTMLTDRGANVVFDLDSVPQELIAIANYLHFTGHTIIDEPKRDSVIALIQRALAHGVTVSIDPATAGFISDFGVAEFLRLCAGVQILRPNEDEACLLAGVDDVDEATRVLTTLFPLVVTTCGRDGVIVGVAGNDLVRVPVEPIDVVDPTGAGDSFNAGLLAALARGLDPVAAATDAARVARSGLTSVGARPA